MKIASKNANTKLYGEGFYGNKLRQFCTVADLCKADPEPHLVMLRQSAIHGGGICIHSLSVSEAYFAFIEHGGRKAGLYFGEQIKNQPENILFQGEYVQESYGEFLRCSNFKGFHRDAMIEGISFSGPSCRTVMRDQMDNRSYEAVIELAEAFPGHIVEFTLCNEGVGDKCLPLIIWEVRSY